MTASRLGLSSKENNIEASRASSGRGAKAPRRTHSILFDVDVKTGK